MKYVSGRIVRGIYIWLSSETSEIRTQTPGNYPKTNKLHLEHGESLKTRINRRYLLFYCTSYRINMFRALLCSSSGAHDYNVDYHIGRFVLSLL